MSFDGSVAVAHLLEVEPKFRLVIDAAGPFPDQFPTKDLGSFSYLLRAIVYQQLSGKAAATIHGRVESLLGKREKVAAANLVSLPDEALRACGLSRGKLLAARDLAGRFLDGSLPGMAKLEAMSDEEVASAVTQVRGVGPWTAQMLLMFRMRRPDVLPATDLGIRKGYALTISNRGGKGKDGLPTPDSILARGKKWAPYRTVASWYLWRSLEIGGGQK